MNTKKNFIAKAMAVLAILTAAVYLLATDQMTKENEESINQDLAPEVEQEVSEPEQVEKSRWEESVERLREAFFVPEAWEELELEEGKQDGGIFLAFSGNEKVRGWYENIIGLGGGWTFIVHPEDIEKLPYSNHWRHDSLKLHQVDEETVEKLKAASIDNPVELELKGLIIVIEGPSWASLNSLDELLEM